MTRRLLHSTVVAAVMTVCAHRVSAEIAQFVTWEVDGQVRRAIVHPPSADSPSGKAPLVLAFHGHGDHIQNFQQTNMQRAWREAIVVYFQGLPSRRDGLSGWQVEKGQDDDRDLKLVDAAIMSLRDKFKVDDARIYATGFSNGGGFTYLLWAERPGVFAAYAPVAARLRPTVRPTQPKPLFHIAGARDATVPFADQEAAIEWALRAHGVGTKGAACGSGCTIYGSGSAAPVMTWIHPGGHIYPTVTAERIAEFFRNHSLQP